MYVRAWMSDSHAYGRIPVPAHGVSSACLPVPPPLNRERDSNSHVLHWHTVTDGLKPSSLTNLCLDLLGFEPTCQVSSDTGTMYSCSCKQPGARHPEETLRCTLIDTLYLAHHTVVPDQ